MRILVTGATGFLGRGLCRRLIDEGFTVRALVRPASDAADLEARGVEIRRGDLRNAWSLAGIARGVDVVVHAAAVHRGGRLGRHDFWQVNSEGTRHLLQEAVASRAERFVYISSAGVQGKPRNGLISEADAPHPDDLYQITKYRGEQAVRRIAHSDGIDAVVLRPCALIGAGEPRFVKLFRPVARRKFVMIGSWQTLTHLLHRDDAVQAIIAACRLPIASGETFLVAGPRPVTMRRLIDGIAQAVDAPAPRARVPFGLAWATASMCTAVCRPLRIEPPIYPRRLGFFAENRAYSTDRIRERLGFKARRELDEALREMAAWYRDQGLL